MKDVCNLRLPRWLSPARDYLFAAFLQRPREVQSINAFFCRILFTFSRAVFEWASVAHYLRSNKNPMRKERKAVIKITKRQKARQKHIATCTRIHQRIIN